MEKTINKKQILYPAVMYCIFAVFLIGYLSSNIKILTNFISDDAYYYFNTARNVGLGLGMSFDGITKTNGFHPLYMLLCIPIFTFFSNYFYLPLIIMIALNLLLHFFSAYIFYKILVKTTKNLNGSLLIFIIYLFNPIFINLSLLGLEFSLNCLMFLLLMLFLLNNKSETIIGFTAGLLLLTRTDNIIFLTICGIYFFYKIQDKKKKIKILTIIIFVFLVWLCFSYFQTGDFLQVSGLAKHLHHSTYQINFFNIDFILFIWNNFYKNSIGWFLDFYALQNFDLTAIMLCLLIIYIFLLSNIKSSVLLLMNIAAIIYFLFYIFYMKYFAYWYFGIIYITIFLTATFFIKKINLKLWFVFLISKIKILILIFIMIYKHNNYDFNYNSIIVQEKIAEYFIQQNIKNINVGSFDSGLNGYFFSFYKNKYGINIINLDCLANNELYHQISKNKFIEFLEKNKIRYFIEGINLYNHILWLGIDQRNSFFNRLKNRHIIYYDMIISEFNSF